MVESSQQQQQPNTDNVVFSAEPLDFEVDHTQDSGSKRFGQPQDEEAFQLVDNETLNKVPLKQVGFSIDVCQGYADFVMHQLYENRSENPLEVLFMMPYSETFTLNKIEVDFDLPDGTRKQIVSRVTEREAA